MQHITRFLSVERRDSQDVASEAKSSSLSLLKPGARTSPRRQQHAPPTLFRSVIRSPHGCGGDLISIGDLELQGLGLFPGEALVAEVAVLGGLVVDGVGEVQLLDNDTRSEVKVVMDDLDQFSAGLVACAIRLDKQRQWLGNTNGV